MLENTKEAEKLQELLSKADSHPFIKKMIEEEANGILAKRTEACAKLADYRLDLEAHRGINKDIDELRLKITEIDKQKEELLLEVNKKRAFLMTEKLGTESDIRQQEELLRTTYDTRIDEAIIFFRDKLDFLRSPGRITHDKRGVERNIFTDTQTVKGSSNYEAIITAINYCRACIQTLEEMKMLPACDMEKIEKMKKGIPPIDIYTEYSGEKPIPDTIIYPRNTLPSDGYMDYALRKLDEGYEKIMHPKKRN
jgi:hypothetical protein